jgi:hypothetical protein
MATKINSWWDGENESSIVVAEECPGSLMYAKANYRRVSGSSYEPYIAGSESWKRAANRALAQCAQSNFERGTGGRK